MRAPAAFLDGITRTAGNLKPCEEYLRAQGRFRRLPPENIAAVETQVTANWERLLALEREALVAPPPAKPVIAPPVPRA
jgi:hypothetical protein